MSEEPSGSPSYVPLCAAWRADNQKAGAPFTPDTMEPPFPFSCRALAHLRTKRKDSRRMMEKN
jgi:hypothetical protein